MYVKATMIFTSRAQELNEEVKRMKGKLSVSREVAERRNLNGVIRVMEETLRLNETLLMMTI